MNDGTANLNNQITGGTPPYVNVDWGEYNPNLLTAGEYNVEVTDDNGCDLRPHILYLSLMLILYLLIF